MTALSSPAKLLVTGVSTCEQLACYVLNTPTFSGASGYLAVWIVKSLLERGFSVRATVRFKEKGEYLRGIFSEYDGKFEYVIVEDMVMSGSFDEAVKGVDGIAHSASPVSLVEDPDDLIIPAVNGTLGILESARKNGSDVKRIVVTSSFATTLEPHPPPYIYTEADWCDHALKEVKEKGKGASPMIKYTASKVMAERAAWNFVKEHQSEIGFDLVTILPTFILGPMLHQPLHLICLHINSPEAINHSVGLLYDALKNPKEGDALTHPRGFVDVRDAAEAHVQALLHEKAGGERFIVGTAPCTLQDIYDALNADSTDFGVPIPKGSPATRKSPRPAIVDSKKIREWLGLNLRTLQESTRDTVLSLRERKLL
ncbi:methylglyoxal reductase (NADPH-dependent) gre2 [Tulasnella sp. 419]|nr:methylglyoxal reductase (NADPH-dependent) gre2 [Tulasnella sp. 419]